MSLGSLVLGAVMAVVALAVWRRQRDVDLIAVIESWLASFLSGRRARKPADLALDQKGNIRLRRDEVGAPRPTGHWHSFPDRQTPVTRFEEFNWRLFVFEPGGDEPWPESAMRDRPMTVRMSAEAMRDYCFASLRPGYPVIIDQYGWWAAASRALERDPDFRDVITDVYFSFEASQRPVVVSFAKPAEKPELWFLRYGFEDFALTRQDLAPYVDDALRLTTERFIGTSEDWRWFSIARLRQAVLRENRRLEANRRQIQRLIDDHQEEAYKNRFVELFDLTNVKPVMVKIAPEELVAELEDPAAAPEDTLGEQLADAVAAEVGAETPPAGDRT